MKLLKRWSIERTYILLKYTLCDSNDFTDKKEMIKFIGIVAYMGMVQKFYYSEDQETQ